MNLKIILRYLFAIGLICFGILPHHTSRAEVTSPSLHIPSIDVTAPIVDLPIRNLPHGITWDTSRLHMTVGFLEMTQWFGQGGNTVLGGHSELARGQADIFWELDQVVPGNEIIINIDGHDRRYIVDRVFTVDQYNLDILRPTVHEQLTLFTCDTGSYDTSNGLYNERIVVVAYPG